MRGAGGEGGEDVEGGVFCEVCHCGGMGLHAMVCLRWDRSELKLLRKLRLGMTVEG